MLANRKREVNFVGNGIAVGRISRNRFVSIADFNLFENLEIGAALALLLQARRQHHVNKRLRAPVKDRKFQVVEFNDGIVQTDPNKS